jgi:hypothetical protein
MASAHGCRTLVNRSVIFNIHKDKHKKVEKNGIKRKKEKDKSIIQG